MKNLPIRYVNGKQTKTYMIWSSMLQRCTNPNNKDYKNYGARGITVSCSWRDFAIFYADMGKKPDGLTLERVNNDHHYCKSNCIWASRKVQANNQRPKKLNYKQVESIRVLLEQGEIKQRVIAKMFNVSPTTICEIKKGRTHENK